MRARRGLGRGGACRGGTGVATDRADHPPQDEQHCQHDEQRHQTTDPVDPGWQRPRRPEQGAHERQARCAGPVTGRGSPFPVGGCRDRVVAGSRMMPGHPLHEPIMSWYAEHRRDLPWRSAGTSPWGVLVSEVMLQQTPVSRVLPVWLEWQHRWPTPGALALAPSGEAVRSWARLGYPRRALRLHAAAQVCVRDHDGELPTDLDDLRALPGVGDYTAAAVASFAFRQRHAVLDTNV